MKKTKRNYIIIALIIVLLSLAIGYAVLRDQLEIRGTANVKGTFDMVFKNAQAITKTLSTSDGKLSTLEPQGVAEGSAVATIGENGDQLNVAVELQYPGAGQAFKVDIVNESTVDAICKNFTFDLQDPDIEVFYPTESKGWKVGDVIKQNESKELIFYVKWKTDSTYSNAETGKEVNFTATFDYEQALTGIEFEGDPENYKVQENI